jgi:replicative DNA helicase
MNATVDHGFALEAEQAVIRALLEDSTGEVLSRVRLTLRSSDLHTLVFRRIFEAACFFLDEGDRTPSASILNMVRSQGYLDDQAKQQVEAAYMASVSLDNLSEYVRLIVEQARGRAIRASLSTVLERVRLIGSSLSSDDVLHELERIPQQFEREDAPVDEILEEPLVKTKRTLDWLDQLLGGDVAPVYMGIPSIDDKTDGHLPCELVIIAGRPGMGKTALALDWLLKYSVPTDQEMIAAVEKPLSVIFSLEMGDIQLVLRSLSNLSGVDAKRIRKSELTDSDYERFCRSAQLFSSSSLRIDTAGSLDPALMRSKLKLLQRSTGKKIGLIVVDYLQLMDAVRPIPGNRNAEITEISRALKKIAKEFGCVVVALSQLSRKVEERANKRPLISDLRESGAIEQDADAIYLLYRDEYYNPDSEQSGLVEVNNAKKRDGEPCVCLAQFAAPCQRFSSPTHYMKEEAYAD